MLLVARLKIVVIIIVISAVMIGATIALYMHPISGDKVAYKYVTALGWEVERIPVETINVKIPEKLGEVYAAYNQLQNAAGFDLEKVAGRICERVTFIVKNFDGDDVRVNALVYKGKVVGGDICSIKMDGFMLPLLSYEESIRERDD